VCLRHSKYGDADPAVREAADRAVALAEESGDAAARAAARLALHDAIWAPGTAKERLVVAEEMLNAAEKAQVADLIAQAHLLRATALLELGDPTGRDALLTYVRLAQLLGHPRGRWGALTRQATYAQIAGRVEEAAALGEQALELGRSIEEPDALGVFFTHRYALVALGISEPGGTLDDTDPMWPLRPLVSAWPHAARGDEAATTSVLGDFSVLDIPVSTSLEAPAAAAVVFAVAGTDQQRRWVYDLLLPFAGTHVVVGGCASYHAAVDYHLGILAASLGDRTAAESHLQTALGMHQRVGAAGWARLSTQALETLTAGIDNEFRRHTDGWILTYDGQQVWMPDAKGLNDLWQILSAQGAEIHVLTLLGVGDRYVPTGADPVLDPRAKAEYKAHIAHLESAIEDAEDAGETSQADLLRAERSAIIRELAAATGLGGRDRRLGAETERARKTISARVRDSVNRIERLHPELAAHLRNSIQMGTACAYQPADAMSWRLR
jgi:tetratricopeptide (TPR) repeat protein